MAVYIDNQQSRQKIDLKAMETKARAVLAALGSRNAELSVRIVGDREIAALNKRYLKRTGPTNVIAFPMREGAFGNLNAQLLGDVVISADTAAREARDCGISRIVSGLSASS